MTQTGLFASESSYEKYYQQILQQQPYLAFHMIQWLTLKQEVMKGRDSYFMLEKRFFYKLTRNLFSLHLISCSFAKH